MQPFVPDHVHLLVLAGPLGWVRLERPVRILQAQLPAKALLESSSFKSSAPDLPRPFQRFRRWNGPLWFEQMVGVDRDMFVALLSRAPRPNKTYLDMAEPPIAVPRKWIPLETGTRSLKI